MKKQNENMSSFRRFVTLTVIMTYLVILAGAVVRGTGSGLGCPDWPRCFGQWVPPTELSELPTDYKEVYKIAGKTIADFDPYKTWTEYLNRLAGALLGFMVLVLFIKAIGLRHKEKNLAWFCGFLLLLVSVQGGIGALVVSTHLKPFIITIHMFLAIILLFGLIYLKKYCSDLEYIGLVQPAPKTLQRLSKILIAVTLIQTLLGTQVRQLVDHLMRDLGVATAETVIGQLGVMFYIHRSFSLVLILLNIYLIFKIHRLAFNRPQFVNGVLSLFCLGANVFSGVKLNYFDFPTNMQPPHLFFAILAIGLQFSLYLKMKGTLLDD